MNPTDVIRRLRRKVRQLRPPTGMKVFGIGLPKTGTKTLAQCFEALHFKHRSFDMELAAEVKRGPLEGVLAEAEKFETFEDWPWFLIYQELDRTFPGSKFILTLRKNAATYVESLRKHHERQGIRNEGFAKPPWWDDVFGFPPNRWDYDRSAANYERHRLEVLEYFESRPDDLLVVCWENGDAWESICRFLDRPRPSRSFPHENSASRRVHE
jgi:hypothetical protein